MQVALNAAGNGEGGMPLKIFRVLHQLVMDDNERIFPPVNSPRHNHSSSLRES